MKINIEELKRKLKESDLNIIDIRAKYDYDKGFIGKAINIREDLLLANPNYYLNKKDTYYLYCNSGDRSKLVTNYLNILGFKAVNIEGGYNNYLLTK